MRAPYVPAVNDVVRVHARLNNLWAGYDCTIRYVRTEADNGQVWATIVHPMLGIGEFRSQWLYKPRRKR